MASTNPARGMRDFLPADVRKRNYVIGIIKQVYESYGFEPLETPSVENLETLMGKYGDEGNQLVFKILKRGDKLRQETGDGRKELKESDLADLALRYDLTVPLARVVANNKNDLPKFFKRYQIQPVWRADRPARGRFREFYQCDVDAIGSESVTFEAEILSAVSIILEKLGFRDYSIRFNHRDVLTGLLLASQIPKDKHEAALVALDKIDKIGQEGVASEFGERGIERSSGKKLLAFYEFFIKDKAIQTFDQEQRVGLTDLGKKLALETDGLNEAADILSRLQNGQSLSPAEMETAKSWLDHQAVILREQSESLIGQLPLNQQASARATLERARQRDPNTIAKREFHTLLNELLLSRVLRFTKEDPRTVAACNRLAQLLHRFPTSHLTFDPTLARGLSYYTGTIMEIVLTEGDFKGSIGGGGRYDGLIGMFGKEQIPACGFSLGLERILVVMEERGMFPPEIAESTPADVMVTIWNEETIADSLKLANELRSQGLRVTLYPEPDKLGKQFKYADQINVPFVCILGETEIAENKVTLKNLKSGEQTTVEQSEIAALVALSK